MDLTTSLIGFLFFIGICVAMYKIARIRDDVRGIRQLLQQQAGGEETEPSNRGFGNVFIGILIAVLGIFIVFGLVALWNQHIWNQQLGR
jgi:hypothetical protein